MFDRSSARVVVPVLLALLATSITPGPPSGGAMPTPTGLTQTLVQDAEVDVRSDPANSLRGLVIDAAGEPIEGALVWCVRDDDPPLVDYAEYGRPLHVTRTLEEHLAAAENNWRESATKTRSCVTSADGRFELSPLEPGRDYRVTVAAADAVTHPSQIGMKRPGDDFTVTTEQPRGVRLEVVDEKGRVPESALIHIRRRSGTSAFRWTPDSPVLTTTEQVVTIRALVGQQRRVESLPPRVNLVADLMSPPTPVDMLAQDGETLRLVVGVRTWLEIDLDDPWRSSGGVGRRGIYVVPLADGQELDLDANRFRAGGDDWIVGRAVVAHDLEPGRHAVVLRVDHDRAVLVRQLDVVAGPNRIAIDVPAPDPDRHAIVTALDSRGRRLLDARVTLEQLVDDSWLPAAEGLSTLSSEGLHWVRVGAIDPRATRLRALVIDADRGMASAEGGLDQRLFQVDFLAPGSLTLQLDGYGESNLAGRESIRMLLVRGSNGTAGSYAQMREVGRGRRAFVSPEGQVRFDGLAAGTWRLVAVFETASAGTMVALEETLEIEPGATPTVTMDFPMAVPVVLDGGERRAGARFLFVDAAHETPRDDTTVIRHPSIGNNRRATVLVLDVRGRCDLGELPEGRYRVCPLAADGRVLVDDLFEIDVAAGTETIAWEESR